MNLKLISNLNFGEKLNSVQAVSESGKSMLNNYKAYIFNNEVTYGLVNGFIKEASQYSRWDSGVASILESILNYVNDNKVTWKLSSVVETMENTPDHYNYIAKLGLGQVNKLLEMNESQVVQYIKAGALKNVVAYSPEIRNICKEVYKTNVVEETYTPTYNLVNPLSYILKENNEVYFSVLGKTFKFNNDIVEEAQSENQIFNTVNSLLPNFSHIDDSLVYECKFGMNQNKWKFTLTEDNATVHNGFSEQSFKTAIELREWAEGYAKAIMSGKDKFDFLSTTHNVATVFEAIPNIAEADRTKIMYTATGDILAITEADQNVNVTVFKSVKSGYSSTNYQFMNEALSDVKKITAISLTDVYENRINEDLKKADPDKYQEMAGQMEAIKEEKIELRRKKIQELAESCKNDPAAMALLNIAAKELSMLE